MKISPNLQVKTENAAVEKADHFSLFNNYPNPFNPQASIDYTVPKDADIKLTIYNISGEKVKMLVNEHQTAGYKRVYWGWKGSEGGRGSRRSVLLPVRSQGILKGEEDNAD